MVPTCTIARDLAPKVAVSFMEHSGYKAQIMAASKLHDNGSVHKLPQGTPISAIPIYCLPGCPDSWVREAGTYVVAVRPDIGLWFDWTSNNQYTTAVVPSVKGQNPITGQKMEGGQMEQYRDVCPVHKVPFAHNRHCPECGFSWSPQNYVAHPDTLWWDGYFQNDGTVRQFFYTEDMSRDIASLSIGEENTMPAFGFAFFKYKHDPLVQQFRSRGLDIGSSMLFKKSSISAYHSDSAYYSDGLKGSYEGGVSKGSVTFAAIPCSAKSSSASLSMRSATHTASNDSRIGTFNFAPAEMQVMASLDSDDIDTTEVLSAGVCSAPGASAQSVQTVRKVAIGGGAVIDQKLSQDLRPLDDYHAAPQAVMRIYFVFEDGKDGLRDIISRGGIREITEKKGGFLNGLPVG